MAAVAFFIPDWRKPPQKYIVLDAEGLRIRGESRLIAPQEALATGSVLETGMVPQDGALIDLKGCGDMHILPLSSVRLADQDGIHMLKSGVIGVRANAGSTQVFEAPRLGRMEISGLAWLSVGKHSSEMVVLEGSAMVFGRRLGASTSLVIDGHGRRIEGKLDLEQHGKLWIDRTVLASARTGKWTSPSSSITDESALDHHTSTVGVQVPQGQKTSIPIGMVGAFARFHAEIGINHPTNEGFGFAFGSAADIAIGGSDLPQFGQQKKMTLLRQPGNTEFHSKVHLTGYLWRVGWSCCGPIFQFAIKPGGGRAEIAMFGKNDPCILTLEVTGKTTAKLLSYSFSSSLGQMEPPAP